MDRLYQNIVIFFYIFSRDNPNGICRSNSKTCQTFGCLFGGISVGLILILIIALIYFFLIGLGFLTSYILYHQSYDILTGCPTDDPNCSMSKLFCNGRTNGSIFGLCLGTGLLSGFILFLCLLIGIPILYHIILGIFTILNEIYESFKHTKENITIKNNDVKNVIVELDDVKNVVELDVIKNDNIKLNDVKFDN